MVKKIFYILSLYTVASLAGSCTKLHEQVLDETSSTGSTEKEVTEGLIAPVYAILPGLFQHTQYFALQQISTDQAILPYRGGTDWGDNGIYISLLRHETTSADPNVRNVWNNLTQGISRAILAITALPSSTDPNAPLFLAEARGMRAYYNLLCLDLFGIAFQKDDPQTNSVILRGNDAIEYIKSELLAIEPLLRDDTGPGRISKQAVWGLLARLHLQSAVYRDIYASSFSFTTDDMDKVIQYCDQIINSGKFALSPEYFEIFDDANHTNKELIFAVDQRADLNGHNRMAYFSLSGDQFPLAAYPGANGTDGPGITSDFYQTWKQAYAPNDPADMDGRFFKRNLDTTITCIPGNNFHIDRGILRGQQYGLIRTGGAFETCPNGDMKVGKLYNNTRNRPDLPVFFTEEINFSDFSNYNNGYRVEKYEFSRGSVSGRNFGEHDIVILRLADIYLMRAEAQLRKGAGNEAAALNDVNTIRAARTARIVPPALTEMNLDLLYRERGFELYWENIRRTDMIRFGKYEGTWTEKTNSDPKKRIFPIPQNAIDGASNLPGYLVQNDSY
ncbi:RagB/SusD family nutrient uptake outer membrane protein [Agriterribacter sp.]|uniref:RagB/SusD family nutrient uptake outer membrane protein n=1 Tax=Agriterribacter sp. TaxID=2821509 RepID=UPI002B8A7A0B|nr:RagB/SusD family nutrient uptake outer membrane protein [Agriterribacter sp.]HRO46911.1 RagB/SusD family nutrient uptake outer membrane protein [Agriterribacter sp.]HRQ17405.1 RagB/SusD family nutrient uptake outer membrane protein [Agriterribacter sp.]